MDLKEGKGAIKWTRLSCRTFAFQMAEVAIPRQMFQEILRLIAELRPHAATRASMKRLIVTRSSAIDREECVQMPVKITRSAHRPSFGLPELLVAIHTWRQSCSKARKARIFALVWESSGESRFKRSADSLLSSKSGG
jgi:hypothetical protein